MFKIAAGVFVGMLMFAALLLGSCAYWGHSMERAQGIAAKSRQ